MCTFKTSGISIGYKLKQGSMYEQCKQFVENIYMNAYYYNICNWHYFTNNSYNIFKARYTKYIEFQKF